MIKPMFKDFDTFCDAVREGDRIAVHYATQSAAGSFLAYVSSVESEKVKAGRFTVDGDVTKAYTGRCGKFEEGTIIET